MRILANCEVDRQSTAITFVEIPPLSLAPAEELTRQRRLCSEATLIDTRGLLIMKGGTRRAGHSEGLAYNVPMGLVLPTGAQEPLCLRVF